MPFWVYMLLVGSKSSGSNRRIYTGYTKNLGRRILQHSGISTTKGARLTRNQPIEFVYAEKFPNQKKAMQRERQLKHEAPFNKKEYKLRLIRQFKEVNLDKIEGVNMKLTEYFEFQKEFVRDLKGLEKILSAQHE